MSQNLSANKFEWIKDTCQFNKNFVTNYKRVINNTFSKLMFNTLRNFIMVFHNF